MKNQEELSKRILKRYNTAKDVANQWRTPLEEVYEYVLPNRNSFSVTSKGQKKDTLVFDSTPLIATNKFVSRLQNLLVRPWTDWFNLQAGNDIQDDQKGEVDKYLQKVSDVILTQINHSNFSTQIAEAFQDLAVSTGVIMVTENPDPASDSDLLFKTIPLSEIAMETCSTGEVKTVYREFDVPLNQIEILWPNAKLTEEMIENYNENPTAEYKLIEGTIYREEEKDYEFVVMTVTGKILLHEIIEDSPFIVFREYVAPGETFGRGRLMSLISDIKTLNKVVEFGLNAAALSIAGVWTAVDDGLINPKNIRIQPNVIIPVRSNASTNPSIARLESPNNVQLEQFKVQEIRQRINDMMLVEPFGSITETSVRSATEMNIRQNDFMQTSISSFSRLQTELLSKIINKVINILKRTNKIPEFTVDGKQVKIKYSSPLSKMQGIEEIQKYQQFIEMMQTVPPEVVQTIVKFDAIPGYIADALGLDKTLLRTKPEQKQLRKELNGRNGIFRFCNGSFQIIKF